MAAHALQRLEDARRVDTSAGEGARRLRARRSGEEAEQQVLDADELVAELAGLLLGFVEDLDRVLA